MRLSKLFFALIFAVLCVKTAHAQNNLTKGYYVDFKRDTVHGFFDFEDLAINKVDFYADTKTVVPQKLTPENISQIEASDFVSVRTYVYAYQDQKEPLFITKFASGNITLYKGYTSNPDEKEAFFINSVKVSLIRKISKNNPKEFLNIYFKGCELKTNFSVEYGQNSLIAAIKEISKCAFPDAKIEEVKRKPRKIRVELGAKVGYFANTSKVDGLLGKNYSDLNFKPIGGLVLGVKLFSKMGVYSGVNIFTRQIINTESLGLYCDGSLGCYYIYPFSLETTFVEIPVAIHYEFNENKPNFIPKILLGGSLLKVVNAKISDAYKLRFSDGLYNTDGINASFFVGGGVRKVLKNGSAVELCLKYASEVETISFRAFISSNRFELSFNYLFSLTKQE